MSDKYIFQKILKFKCIICNETISFEDILIKLWEYESEIGDIVDESFMLPHGISVPVSESDWADFRRGIGGVFIEFTLGEKICNCEKNHIIKLYIIFSASMPYWNEGKYTCYLEEIDEIIPLTSNTLILMSEPQILKGKEILFIIHFLFERWAALQYQIEIFSPFISIKTCWNPLLNTVEKFNYYDHSLSPIFIYTRKDQDFGNRTVESQILAWINDEKRRTQCEKLIEFEDEPPCYENPYFKCIHNYGKFLTSNVYYTEKYFHAKFYSGINNKGLIETVITSFNLIHQELEQYETFCFTSTKNDYFDKIRNGVDWNKVTIDENLFRVFNVKES